ncbi:MAG: zinc ribbon domain-containing protein [Betaproteobacteria bacterium]|nr:zinc ribbon domain-containing protein [Betaproteobacteria bacterium]MDE2622560.1 zinc ribbon domain-containing protein [Betaproteobacteria bacterium]
MPTYDFLCPNCGPFDRLLRMGERDANQHCTSCGALSPRMIAAAPQLADMPEDRRKAMAVNEKSAHEPSHRNTSRHGRGCSCCSGGSASKAPKGFAHKRPWMISH